MYKNCQTEYSAARQHRVEQQLLKELAQRHYEDITVSDLCRSTGISRKSFYRYFSGKQGVLEALLDHTILQADKAIDIGLSENVSAVLTVAFRFWKDQSAFLDTLSRSGLLEVLVDRAVLLCQEAYSIQHSGDAPDQACMSRYQIEFMISGLMRMMLHWYRDGFPLPEGQMASAVTLFLSALF